MSWPEAQVSRFHLPFVFLMEKKKYICQLHLSTWNLMWDKSLLRNRVCLLGCSRAEFCLIRCWVSIVCRTENLEFPYGLRQLTGCSKAVFSSSQAPFLFLLNASQCPFCFQKECLLDTGINNFYVMSMLVHSLSGCRSYSFFPSDFTHDHPSWTLVGWQSSLLSCLCPLALPFVFPPRIMVLVRERDHL